MVQWINIQVNQGYLIIFKVREVGSDDLACVVPDLRVSGQFEGVESCNTSGSLDSQYRWTSLIGQGMLYIQQCLKSEIINSWKWWP